MKLLIAILWPDCLKAVHDALDRREAYVVSAAPVLDDEFSVTKYRGVDLRQARVRFRVEIVVPNDLAVPETIEALERLTLECASHRAVVAVAPLEDAVRLPRCS